MNVRRYGTRRIGGALLLVAVCAAGSAAAQSSDELEAALEAARAELDAAAEKLAALHRQMFEDRLGDAGKPMLGLLLGEQTDQRGVPVVAVTPGGGAAAAGLAAGDELLAINGERFDGGEHASAVLDRALEDVDAGASVEVEYLREGDVRAATITTQPRRSFGMGFVRGSDVGWQQALEIDVDAITEAGQVAATSAVAELNRALPMMHHAMRPGGLRLEEVSGDLAAYFGVEQGVLVLQVPEAAGDLRGGDILLTIDGAEIASVADAFRLLHAQSAPVTVDVLRQGARSTVQVRPDALGAAGNVIFLNGGPRSGTVEIEAIGPR